MRLWLRLRQERVNLAHARSAGFAGAPFLRREGSGGFVGSSLRLAQGRRFFAGAPVLLQGLRPCNPAKGPKALWKPAGNICFFETIPIFCFFSLRKEAGVWGRSPQRSPVPVPHPPSPQRKFSFSRIILLDTLYYALYSIFRKGADAWMPS